MQAVLIIFLSTFAAVVYGIVHDLITAHMCVEYFTVTHPPILGGTKSPVILALGWGVIATWWVGLPLGIVVAFAARVGGLPKLAAKELVKPFAVGLGVMLPLAMGTGLYAYYNMPIPGEYTTIISPGLHKGFMFNAAAHLASYAMGPILAIVLCIWSIVVRAHRNIRDVRALAEAWASHNVDRTS